jgi:hypothetical protein
MSQIVVKGLDDFRRDLRRVDKNLPKAIGKAHKKIAVRVADKAKPAVRGLPTPGGSRAEAGIRGNATQKAARITLLGSNPTVRANVFGTLSHKVWGRHVTGSGPWQPWIGKTWQPEQLFGIGPVIGDVADGFALDEYADEILDAFKVAFPIG